MQYKERSHVDWAIRKYLTSEEDNLHLSGTTALAALLDCIPWKYFLRIRSFGSRQRFESDVNLFVNSVETTMKAPMTRLLSYEVKPFLHLHALLAFDLPEDRLVSTALRAQFQESDFDLQNYDRGKGGLPYILKTINLKQDKNYQKLDENWWDIQHVELWNGFKDGQSREVRKRIGRHLKRLQTTLHRRALHRLQ